MPPATANIIFILVNPVYLGNIGAAARVMKNFGFTRLRLVAPPANYKDAEARKMAVGAFDILKTSEVFATIADALQDIHLAVGTTSGQQREFRPLPFASTAADMVAVSGNNHQTALLFGDERNGLSRQDLARCHRTTTITTDPEFPALNLAQAVAVCAYELNRLGSSQPATATGSVLGQLPLPSGGQDDELFEQLGTLLDATGFSRTFNRQNVLSELRSFYQRAQPTAREAALLKGALHSIMKNIADNA